MRWYFVRIIKTSHYVYKRAFDCLNLLLRFIKLQQKSYLILLLLLASSTGYGSCKMVCYVIIYVFLNVNCYFVNTSKKKKKKHILLLSDTTFYMKYILIGLRVIFHGWHSFTLLCWTFVVWRRKKLSRSITINMCTHCIIIS